MCFFVYFKELSLNTKKKKDESLYHLIVGKGSVVVGVVRFLVEKPSDFHNTTFLVSTSLFKVQ